jgi:Asp-tRNA(Asn)/Glu-tRNA(Gln) amidotransferase A subunit family amidase
MSRRAYIPTESSLVSYRDCLRAFRDGSDSPRNFLEKRLAVIEDLEQEVQAFTAIDIEGARKAADVSTTRYRDGRPLSQIDGMPVGIKDVIDTVDMPTQMGSPLFKEWRPRFDAASVSALRKAGAAILGKTVTTEFAAVVPGPTRNPFDSSRTPGGSSSGSAAAVGIGMIPAGLGTQVIGSIIRPSSYCGCYGYKPTMGTVNRGGSLDYMSQSTQGVLAASLGDAWAVI